MPKVGDKEFPYTDEGMRQANIHSKRTGQNVVYHENNGKFGYQTGGSTGRNVYDTIPVERPRAIPKEVGIPQAEQQARGNAFKRRFIQDHGRLPSDMKEPPSLLDESMEDRMANLSDGQSQWPGYEGKWGGFTDQYQGGEFTPPPQNPSWMDPRFGPEMERNEWLQNQEREYMMRKFGERMNFQEGGMAYPDTETGYSRPLNMMRKAILGNYLPDERISSNINPSTADNVTDIRDIVTNIDAYNKQIDPMMELRSVTSPKNIMRSERREKVDRLMGQMGFQEGGEVDVRRPTFGFSPKDLFDSLG